MKTHIPKTVRKSIVAVIILIILFGVGGVAYVFVADRDTKQVSKQTAAAFVESSPVPKPKPPGANAPEGVAIESIMSPIAIGANTSVNINTNAGSSCIIIVTYNGVQSKDSGLGSKMADAYGNVNWTWTVDSSVPIGSWPIKITCTYHGRSGVAESNVQVTK